MKGVEGAEEEGQLPGARAVISRHLPLPATCAPG